MASIPASRALSFLSLSLALTGVPSTFIMVWTIIRIDLSRHLLWGEKMENEGENEDSDNQASNDSVRALI